MQLVTKWMDHVQNHWPGWFCNAFDRRHSSPPIHHAEIQGKTFSWLLLLPRVNGTSLCVWISMCKSCFNIQISDGRTIWISTRDFSFHLHWIKSCFIFMPVVSFLLHWKLIEILHTLCSNYPTPHLKHAKWSWYTVVWQSCCCFLDLWQYCKQY